MGKGGLTGISQPRCTRVNAGPTIHVIVGVACFASGRAPGNHLVVDHPTVSRQHATIKLEGEDYRVYDLGSANGTFVQDQRVRDPIVLQDGVIVRFGEVEFIFKRVSFG